MKVFIDKIEKSIGGISEFQYVILDKDYYVRYKTIENAVSPWSKYSLKKQKSFHIFPDYFENIETDLTNGRTPI